MLKEILALEMQKSLEYEHYLRFIQEELKNGKGESSSAKREGGSGSGKKENANDVLRERNELYKMSEDLYEQLKRCMKEQDEYLA